MTMHALLVDSDAPLRSARARALQARHWQVADFASVEQALVWLREQARQLDLLVTEAVFAHGASGFDLRAEAQVRFPEMRTLFTTRFDLSGFETLVAGSPVLIDAPPFETGELIESVNALLKAPPPPTSAPQGPLLPPGTRLGNYEIHEWVRSDSTAESYRALQQGVERVVGLVMLRPEHASDPGFVARFKARERAKASFNHPRVAPLYEAGEENGHLFYTREVPRGRSLKEIAETGETLNERALVELLHGVSEVMDHATAQGLRHRDISAWDVYLDDEHQASMVNIFRPAEDEVGEGGAESVETFLRMLRGRVAGGKTSGLLQSLAQVGHDWASLHQEMTAVRDAMRERSIQDRIEREEPAQTGGDSRALRSWWLWAAAAAVLILVAALGALTGDPVRSVNEAAPDEMVEIPAGPFLYQKGEQRVLPAFWISRTEVTLGQYAEFLEALKSGPASRFDHPDQPAGKRKHEPEGWRKLLEAARTGATYNGEKISLQTPVHNVDWWDAYAYAKWKRRRLPTEEEWEKAARGPQGRVFPWGASPDQKAANTGEDYAAGSLGKGGQNDGHNLWAPVDRETRDVSAYGIQDMAGNVEEWTASERNGEPWPPHPEFPDVRAPAVRGGHFAQSSSKGVLTARRFAESASETSPARGFRTVSDLPEP